MHSLTKYWLKLGGQTQKPATLGTISAATSAQILALFYSQAHLYFQLPSNRFAIWLDHLPSKSVILALGFLREPGLCNGRI